MNIRLMCLVFVCLCAGCLLCAQDPEPSPPKQAQATPAQQQKAAQQLTAVKIIDEPKLCPGGFATDLNQPPDCNFTEGMRLERFVAGSLTDQAMTGAVVYGLMAQVIRAPEEWPRTWDGYGRRVGVRYTQAVAKGTAEFAVGSILHNDPRYISYANDPRTEHRTDHNGWQRFGHVWLDTLTERHSNKNGDGIRLPAFGRFAGAFANAYGGYPWYPQSQNDFYSAGKRAAGSLGSSLAMSFYTEYGPDLAKLAKKVLGKGKTKTPSGAKK